MYLANDVIQNSRKKGPEYGKEFGLVLRKVFEHLSTVEYDEKMKGSLGRILTIWGERGMYDELQITEFRQAWGKFSYKVILFVYLFNCSSAFGKVCNKTI